jgi:signal transduction histidine kinase
MLIYGLFGILDAKLAPDLLHEFLLYRFAISIPVAAIILGLSFTRGFYKYYQAIASLITIVAGGFIVLMVYKAWENQNEIIIQTYYVGLILVFIFSYNFLKMRFIWASISGFILLGLYEFLLFTTISPTPELALSSSFFLISANLMGMFSSYLFEFSFRKEFYTNEMLKKEKQRTQELNDNLETEIRKRTRELNNAREKAEQSDHLKSMFLANMSHEIRTPLNGILGFTDLLQNEDLDEQRKNLYLNIINDRGNYLLSILNNIIDFSLIRSNQLSMNEEDFNLNHSLNTLYIFLENNFNKSGTTEVKFRLELEHPDKEFTIHADRTKLEQILTNLVENSSKYTEKGEVIIGYKLFRDYLRLYVADTGAGIPYQYRKYIFRSFAKMEDQDVDFKGGAGLGLAICKGLADFMGANIHFQTEENKGTRFYLDLPASVLVKDQSSRN